MTERTALVTGGGGAIGREIAAQLDARGYHVVLAGITRSRMEEVAAGLVRPATIVEGDLSTLDGIAAFATTIERDFGHLDLLVNNAGHIEPGDVVDVTPEEIERHVLINLLAPMQLSRVAARSMVARGRGDILSVISMGAIIALRGSASYSAAKFGLRGFQTSLQQELAPRGVRVMGVFPSGVDTPMLRREAVHPNGSPLNFVGKVLTSTQVADACMRALDSGKLETYVPYGDSLTTRIVGAVPGLIRRIEPAFAKAGERGRTKFLAARGLSRHQ